MKWFVDFWQSCGWFSKLGIIVIVVGTLGNLFDFNSKPDSYATVAPVLNGHATEAQWQAFNELLLSEGKKCVWWNAHKQVIANAWNPKSIWEDTDTVSVNGTLDVSTNRTPSWSSSGSVKLTGKNAFGAEVSSIERSFFTVMPHIASQSHEVYFTCD